MGFASIAEKEFSALLVDFSPHSSKPQTHNGKTPSPSPPSASPRPPSPSYTSASFEAYPTLSSTNKDPSGCDADSGVSSAYTNHRSSSMVYYLSPSSPHASKEPIPPLWYPSPSSSVKIMEPSIFVPVK